jgi:hypothetical protein
LAAAESALTLETEESEASEEAVPELNDDGSDLDSTDRSFLELNHRFGLSFFMSCMAKSEGLIETQEEERAIMKTKEEKQWKGFETKDSRRRMLKWSVKAMRQLPRSFQ